MDARERFLATMAFGVPDRIPYRFGGPRESTFNAWYKQGLSRDLDFTRFIGYDRWEHLPIDLGPLPRFEETGIDGSSAIVTGISSWGSPSSRCSGGCAIGWASRGCA